MYCLKKKLLEFSSVPSAYLPSLTTDQYKTHESEQKTQAHDCTKLATYNIQDLDIELFESANGNKKGNLETFIITAVAIVLNRYSGQENIVITILRNSTTYQILILNFLHKISFGDLYNKADAQKTQNTATFEEVQLQNLLEQNATLHAEISHLFRFGVGTKLLTSPNFNRFNIFFELGNCTTNESERHIIIHFDPNFYHIDQIKQLATHVSSTLKNGFFEKDKLVQDLQILSEAERHKILFEFNNIQEKNVEDTNSGVSFISIFLQSVSKWPNSISIVQDYGTHRVDRTYTELYQQSILMAKLILTKIQIVATEHNHVGVLLPQGIDNVATNLGILMLGKTIAMIHYANTVKQVEACLRKLGHPILITTREKFKSINIQYEEVIFIDDCSKEIQGIHFASEELNDLNKFQSVDTRNDCPYIFFTSGSTGSAKAIRLTNKCLPCTAFFAVSKYDTSEHLRTMLAVPTGFGLSIFDVWATISVGGTMYIPPEKVRLNLLELLPWIYENDIKNFTVSTGVAEAIVALPPSQHIYLSKVKWVVFTGEKCRQLILKSEHWKFNCSFMYGTSEACIATAFDMYCGNQYMNPPVGKPIKGAQVFVLDEFLQPLPIGVRGEICVGGVGLMGGYLNDVELTATALIPNPFGTTTSIYKTGDIGYWSADGNLTVVGRKDTQVKIHGVRLELGEIETNLQNFPLIKQAVVLISEIETTKHIVAFCTLNPTEIEPSKQELFKFLQQRLQRHAIPNRIEFLDKFPKNPSGKIDRLFLKSLIAEKYNVKENFETTFKFETIRKVWATVIGIPDFHIVQESNFFSLGGNSMTAFKLIASLVPRFPNARVHDIFQFPQFSDFIERIYHNDEHTDKPEPIDFEAECLLTVEFTKLRAPEQFKPNFDNAFRKTVLLTAATGYMGPAFLIEILRLTEFNVVCIVRSKNDVDAQNRMKTIFTSNHLSHIYERMAAERVTVLAGDVSKNLFGLNSAQYQILLTTVDIIYHGAAEVNFIKSFAQMRSTTVAMTRNVIQFATNGKLKWIHHMSSIAVFDGYEVPDGAKCFFVPEERLSPNFPNVAQMINGYCQSKWVTEELIWRAIDAGVPAAIYRIGEVGSHKTLSILNREDALAGFLISCKKILKYPDIQNTIPFVSLDGALNAILSLSQNLMANSEQTQRVFHIVEKNVKIQEFLKCDTTTTYEPVTLSQWEMAFKSVAEFKTAEDVSASIYLNLIKRDHNERNSVLGFRCCVETKETETFLRKSRYNSEKLSGDSCKHYANLLLT